MSTHDFTNSIGVYASVSAQETDSGAMLISLSCYPMSSMISVPMQTAVKLATDILEIANAQIKAAA